VNTWESIFTQSPVNDGYYGEDDLPQLNWEWPKGTWFQGRLDYIREHESILNVKFYKKLRRRQTTASDVTL
jgi:hypothetical protein